MLHSILASIANPVERASATFAMWSLFARNPDTMAVLPVLSPENTSRLRYLRFMRDQRISALELRERLARFAVDGIVNVSISGMDCDCVQYAHCRQVSADFDEYCAWVDDSYEWADGPMTISIISCDAAETFEDYSRDLALEAYEDGHPHVVYA